MALISFQPTKRHGGADADHDEPGRRPVEGAEPVVGRHQQGQHEERQQDGDDGLGAHLGLAGDDLLGQLQVLGDVIGEGAQHVDDDALAAFVGGGERFDHPVRHRVGELLAGLLESGRHLQHGGVAGVAAPHRPQRFRAGRGPAAPTRCAGSSRR